MRFEGLQASSPSVGREVCLCVRVFNTVQGNRHSKRDVSIDVQGRLEKSGSEKPSESEMIRGESWENLGSKNGMNYR